jgi:hypothetical protein
VHYLDSTNLGTLYEVMINFLDGPLSLDPLQEIPFGKLLALLILLIPISNWTLARVAPIDACQVFLIRQQMYFREKFLAIFFPYLLISLKPAV